MKKINFIMLLIMIGFQTYGFGQEKNHMDIQKNDVAAKDTVEYSLLIIDPGFESWLITQPPEEFYSNDYYEMKNQLYVLEWNRRYNTSFNKDLYDNYIDYNSNIEYGIDLNYKLYYYFKYFERTNHINLLNSGR